MSEHGFCTASVINPCDAILFLSYSSRIRRVSNMCTVRMKWRYSFRKTAILVLLMTSFKMPERGGKAVLMIFTGFHEIWSIIVVTESGHGNKRRRADKHMVSRQG